MDRTKTYQGKYTSKDGKVNNVRVRVYKRFGSLVLAMVMVGSITGKVVVTVIDNQKEKALLEEQNQDLSLIESIIKDNPNILRETEMGTYTIQSGDTLSSIAEKCGNTVKRICSLNDIDSKKIIRPGEEIKTETIREKRPKEKEVSCLESYFYNYVFTSSVAEIAKNAEEQEKNGGLFYKSVLYGNPKSEAEPDPNSVYGRYIHAYLRFHSLEEPTEEEIDSYIETLTDLSRETHESLTFNGMSSSLIPYSQYKVYIENGTTKYDTLQETRHSIYS